jgi:hypothetical protein
MDPRDHLRDSLAGVGCTACGAGVPADRIEVLAERDDLVFVQFRCVACGSEALGLVVRGTDDTGATATTDTARYGEFDAADEARLTGRAIDAEDVRRVHTFLERYDGDLRTLVDGSSGGTSSAG